MTSGAASRSTHLTQVSRSYPVKALDPASLLGRILTGFLIAMEGLKTGKATVD